MTPSASIAPRTSARTATALASLALALALAGCASDGTTYGNTSGAPGTGVYVLQNTAATSTSPASASVLEFSTSATGTATPIATITNPGVTSVAFLAVDGTGNLYTTATTTTTTTPSTSTTSIVEYPMGSQNNAQPIRSIPLNATTGLNGISINGLAVDAAGDIFAAAFGSGISVFSPTATGSVAPARSIPIGSQGVDLTTLEAPSAEAVDASGNLYVANQASPDVGAPAPTAPILVFAPAATGSVAPTRTLSGALTTLTFGSPAGIATDPAGNLYVANNSSSGSSILIFSPTATGNTPPLRDITGSNTQLGCLGGIALDTEGYLYVVSTPSCTTNPTASPSVLKFSTTGDGNIAPAATFTSATWTNADPTLSIAVY